MNIFVGNLSFGATQDDVKKLFEGFGNVASVAIVISKEKKAPKSRGFGFVEMPDEQQALAAIAALSGKEFMGRVLNVDPARPKVQKVMVRPPQEENKVSIRKPGSYRGGRRTHSYMKRRGLAGIQDEVKPRRKSQDNPMRWRKREDQPKPWQKSSGEHKPWKKAEGEHKPWKKAEGEHKPWKKAEGEPKPWKKPEAGFKPWKKFQGKPKPWNKAAGESRALGESGEKPKPWKKPAGGAKPWSKSSERTQEYKFKGKGRKKPGRYKR